MTKQVLGHIDCPACGAAKGMRITHDKNLQPFGFCEAECGQQLRIGGNLRRVAAFVKRFPWAGNPPVTGTVAVTAATEPEKAPALPAPAPAPSPAPVAAPAKKPTAKAQVPAPTHVKPPSTWISTLMGVKNA